MPPEIATLGHGDVGAGALVHKHVADIGALLESLIDNLLCPNQLSTTLALVGGDDHLGTAIDDTVAKRVGRETGKDHRVNGADSAASKKGNDSLRDHGQVDGHGVALAHAHLGEHVGELGDIAQELAVGDVPAVRGLVGFVDDGDLVGVLEGMAIDTVV